MDRVSQRHQRDIKRVFHYRERLVDDCPEALVCLHSSRDGSTKSSWPGSTLTSYGNVVLTYEEPMKTPSRRKWTWMTRSKPPQLNTLSFTPNTIVQILQEHRGCLLVCQPN